MIIFIQSSSFIFSLIKNKLKLNCSSAKITLKQKAEANKREIKVRTHLLILDSS